MDHKPDLLDQMAQIVLADPTISTKALAMRLGFAQERSVYYWLQKAGYEGMTAFRRAVLTGAFPTTRPVRNDAVRDTPGEYLVEVPLLAGAPAEPPELPPAARRYLVMQRPVSTRAFAITIDTPEYRPVLEEGDVVLVDPRAEIHDGDLVLVRLGGESAVRRIYGRDDPWLVHPSQPRLTQRPRAQREAHVLGKVIALQREM